MKYNYDEKLNEKQSVLIYNIKWNKDIIMIFIRIVTVALTLALNDMTGGKVADKKPIMFNLCFITHKVTKERLSIIAVGDSWYLEICILSMIYILKKKLWVLVVVYIIKEIYKLSVCRHFVIGYINCSIIGNKVK